VRQGRAAWADLVSDRYSGTGRTTGGIIPEEKVAEVRGWIESYHKVEDHLEKISEINRELLRRARQAAQTKGVTNARRGNERSSCGFYLAFMRRQEQPVHGLPFFARYLNKVFDFRATAATLTDARVAPEIPPSAVFLAAFHGFVFRLPSFQQLEAELTLPALQQWIGAERAFRDDVLRYSLSGFHLEGLQRMRVQVNRTLKRNKAPYPGRVQGRMVAALDGQWGALQAAA
jgi:hypothetical protein